MTNDILAKLARWAQQNPQAVAGDHAGEELLELVRTIRSTQIKEQEPVAWMAGKDKDEAELLKLHIEKYIAPLLKRIEELERQVAQHDPSFVGWDWSEVEQQIAQHDPSFVGWDWGKVRTDQIGPLEIKTYWPKESDKK